MQKHTTLISTLICGFIFISTTIDLNNLFDYTNQTIPSYISKDNTPGNNPITDGGAILGRVLFYDINLSQNNTISCASCHQQSAAFGDPATVSIGWDGGTTGRHSPRLVNARFGEEVNFFWDERAGSLEDQATMPIQDHVEMGFSGTDGDPDMDVLIAKLENLDYYQDLFTFVYGDFEISEDEIQDALAQFVRSIQSFDSKFDVGLAQVNNINTNFPNFTTEENLGKGLFLNNPQNGGANCNICHSAPEFDIDSNSDNNSVISVAGDPGAIDVTNTRSPSLRDLVNPNGSPNGPMMHDGSLTTLLEVINLYDDINVDPANTNLDNRLQSGPGGDGQNLNLTDTEKDNLIAFLGTLTGSEIYTGEQWSDPFDSDGNLTILNSPLPVELFGFVVSGDDKESWLRWSTASERNNEGFEIQHSLDAIDWKYIGFVNGQGDSRTTIDYDFVHERSEQGNNYYRLKQIDFDGEMTFSKTLSHFIERKELIISAYPNPVVNQLSVNFPERQFAWSVYDLTGSVLAQAEAVGNTSIDFTNFKNGIYFLSIYDKENQKEQVKKIIKN